MSTTNHLERLGLLRNDQRTTSNTFPGGSGATEDR